MTERPWLELRAFQKTDMHGVSNGFTLFATGNNAQAHADMVRRSLRCVLDANMEAPELRPFKRTGLLAEVETDRGRYIAACLTILRAYIVAGRPGRVTPLGSYTEWSNLIRSALVWLGEADPAATMETARAEDPDEAATAALLAAWPQDLTDYTTAELIAAAEESVAGEWLRPDLHDAISALATDRMRCLSADKLGKWLRDHKDRISGGRKLVRVGSASRPRWAVEQAGPRE
jgi:putative DNA primase/helicase